MPEAPAHERSVRMMPLFHLRTGLLALAGVFVALGVAALVWPSRLSDIRMSGGAPIAPASSLGSALIPVDPTTNDVIVRSNIFSPTRAAPVTRYAPGGRRYPGTLRYHDLT
jgi:hypothetical protein